MSPSPVSQAGKIPHLQHAPTMLQSAPAVQVAAEPPPLAPIDRVVEIFERRGKIAFRCKCFAGYCSRRPLSAAIVK
jgi:hypothetical protein